MSRRKREEWELIGQAKPRLDLHTWPGKIGAAIREAVEGANQPKLRVHPWWYAAIFLSLTLLGSIVLGRATTLEGEWPAYVGLAAAFVLTFTLFQILESKGRDLLGGVSVLLGIVLLVSIGNLPFIPLWILVRAGDVGLARTVRDLLIFYFGTFVFVVVTTTALSWMRSKSPWHVIGDALRRVGVGSGSRGRK